jgi:hypothetical protein
MPPTEQQTLIQSLELLENLGVVPQAAAALARGNARVSDALCKAVVEEIPTFSSSTDAALLSELERHARSHVEEVERLFSGGEVSQFDFVREHAQRRAEQRFPLEATLHAYRCGHKVLSRWLREAATEVTPANVDRSVAAVADFAIEYTNVVSTICAAEYVARTRTLADSEGDRRTELLNILLGGYEDSDSRAGRLLKRAGYLEQRLFFCVAHVRSVDPLEMENSARVQRIVDSIRLAVAPPTRSLLGLRNNVVTAVFSDARRLSGWTAPRTQLAAQIHAALLVLGPSVLVGVSTDQSSSAGIPRASHEASVALDFASAGERVLRYSDLTIRRLLLHGAAAALETTLPVWFAELAAADVKARGALIATLRALADCDLNVQQAARSLGLHPNTVYARMQRISDLTGLDCRRYHHLSELLLAADCRQAVTG